MRWTNPQDWPDGFAACELDFAQERFGFQFPPDLYELLQVCRPPGSYDWALDFEDIERAFRWPFEGLLFDVEENGLWWPELGERPTGAADREAVLLAAVAAAPRLIPVYSHRYLPELPNLPGNPIFSVYQSDVICYGANLQEYLVAEFGGAPTYAPGFDGSIRQVPFWATMVERNV